MTEQSQLSLDVDLSERKPAPKTGRRSFKVAGLFAGIGGLELGLSSAGHETVLLCENDPSANLVLADRFPDVRRTGDVCELKSLPRGTDLLVGGFPCQDLSQAGKTVGIAGSRSGLVGEVFRLLRTKRVPWLVLENVPFMLQLARGAALDVIIDALEDLGYQWAYRVIDSRAFGVPQRRRRVFLVASLDEDPRHVLFSDEAEQADGPDSLDGVACGFYWTEGVRGLGWAVDAVPTLKGGSTVGIPSPPAIWLPSGEIVKPNIRDAERMQGFRPGWTEAATVAGRKSFRWKLVGNAVSVPVARWLGERLARPKGFALSEVQPLLRPGRSWPSVAWNVGAGRMTTELSSWPVRRKQPPLIDFLRYPTEPLSEKATAGFLNRTAKGTLRFPDGFLNAVENHLENVRARATA
jgi:DNA (cytosine-5)-methyltransferase 1